jgi:hypothetical protein
VGGVAVTEEEWLARKDFEGMLHFAASAARLTPRQRKVRLLLCARWRERIQEPEFGSHDMALCEAAVDLAERYADGDATPGEAEALRKRLASLDEVTWKQEYYYSPKNILVHALEEDVSDLLLVDYRLRAHTDLGITGDPPFGPLADLFGNPCRPAPALDAAWASWGDGTVRRLAQGIYGARAFGEMPVLGDALEDAGCADAVILTHCRRPGEHFRGCWVLDQVLGKR